MNWQLIIALFSILSLHVNAQDFELSRPPPPTNASPEILGGQKAIPENWPATFVFITATGDRCTATVIGPKVVLTAAHCIVKGPSGGIEGSSVSLTCTPHSYYGGGSGHDIALCRASSEIRLKNDAPYETLSNSEGSPKANHQLALLGYGCTDTGAGSKILYEGTALVSTPASELQPFFETKGESAVCFGDSGGGAYLAGPKGGRLIVGIASKTIGNGISRFSIIPAAVTRQFIDSWASKQVDPKTGAKILVRICGIDQTLHSCNS